LLFRASEHNFKAEAFHTKCDGKNRTLTIVRTEFRKTIFAYAESAWNSSNAFSNDTTNRSCILLLNPRLRFSLASPAHSIYCHLNHGPVFGNGNDLNLQANGNGCVSCPTGYTCPGYANNQVAWTTMTGSSTNIFKIADYEVYQLIFD